MLARRVGLIVPSSNTTMETEIPALLAARTRLAPEERFTFHASRMRMKKVSAEELARMDGESLRCAGELADARCEVMAYACLVAVMASGPGYHAKAEARLSAVAEQEGGGAPVVTSAGALVTGLHALGARKVAMIAPYMKPLTQLVIDYLANYDIEVKDSLSLEVADNVQVGRLDPAQLPSLVRRLDLRGVDALVLSACVQMPSLPVLQRVEDLIGLPVLSAATATTHAILRALGLSPRVPDAGRLLS